MFCLNNVTVIKSVHFKILAEIKDLINFIYPIKLTEDILKQLGFTYNEVYQLIDGSSFTLNDDFTICDIDFYVKCEYLHELQNAYKVLKGKELPININTLKI